MVFSSVRNRLAALLLGAALVAPAMAQTVLALPAAQAPGSDVRQALTLPPGSMLRLESLTLDEASGEVASADLRRTNAGSAPLLVVHSGTDVTTTRPAQRAHFTGQLVGDPKSSVFVSIDEQGALRSIVRRGEEVFVSDMPAPGASDAGSFPAPALRARRVELTTDAPATPFTCGVDDQFIQEHYAAPSAALLESLHNNHQRAGLMGVASQGPQALGAQRRADVIIETDYELFQLLGSAAAVQAYVTDLMGYVSSQYESEIGVRLNLTQINVYTSPSDPWIGSSTSTLLTELRTYWNAAGRSSQARHHVHLLSARNVGGGIAYLNTLASTSKSSAYGVSGGIKGTFSASNPQVIWDSVVVAHEIGHAFGSDHAHNFDAPYIGSNQGGAIDCCYAEDVGSQCSAQLGGAPRYGVLPGINSISGGSAGTGAGTIMSYCHTLSPGIPNISFNFGTNHARGVNPWRVASVLQSSAQTYLPLDTVVQNYTLSVSRQGTGSGTVTSNPAGINCGSTCSTSYVAGTSVTLVAYPASGSSFTGWGGACSGTSSCTVSMDSARSVTASFGTTTTTRPFTLNKAGSGTGSVTITPPGVTCEPSCTRSWPIISSNAVVTLVAQASVGSTFAGWSGACTGTGSCTIAAGSSAVEVTASFNSNSGGGPLADPATFVMQQYLDFWRRTPDSVSLNYWVGQLNTGATTRAQVIQSLMNSAEFQGHFGPLVRLYTAYFLRTPDYGGLMFWFNTMYPGSGYGSSLAQVSDAFAQSAEFVTRYGALDNAGFVTRVYQNVLGRNPEADGFAYWLAQLNGGMSRGQLMIGFSESVENQNATANAQRITLVYVGMLQRVPNATEHSQWLADMNVGRVDVLSLISTLLQSPEYAARF